MHHLKGLSVLLATAAIVAGAVVGLRALIVTEEVRFADALEEGAIPEDFVPVAVGGELMVTGEREGAFSLVRHVSGPTYGLGGDDGRIFFEGQGESLGISQFAYDGLEFFPDEGECTVTPGRVNESAGVAAVTIDCPDIRDIRDTATITVHGVAGLVAGLVLTDIPPEGGTVAVGSVQWQIEGAFLNLDPEAVVLGGENDYPLVMHDEVNALSFSHDDGRLTLEELLWDGSTTSVDADDCQITTQDLMKLSPEVTLVEVTIDCPAVAVAGRGEVEISGTVVVQRFSPPSEH